MKDHKYCLFPNGNKNLFYSGSDSESLCIGHLRLDFGNGHEFNMSWWPHAVNVCDDIAFKGELSHLVCHLRRNLFKDRAHMYKYIADHPATVLEDNPPRYYGYSVHTARYAFYIRCTPERGNYSYIYCYKIHQEDL